MAGWVVRRIASDRWMTMPGIFTLAGCLAAGTVIVMSELGPSIRPCRSAAVWWLRTAPGPARSRARPQHRLPCGFTGMDRINAPLEPLPATAAHPGTHRTRVDASPGALTAGNGSTLDRQQFTGLRRHFDRHEGQPA